MSLLLSPVSHNTVAFNSIHHRALCITGLTKFWFHHILKLLLHMEIYIYVYISSKIQKFWPEKAIFLFHILSSFINLLHDAWQMLRFVNLTCPNMCYMMNWNKCYSTLASDVSRPIEKKKKKFEGMMVLRLSTGAGPQR